MRGLFCHLHSKEKVGLTLIGVENGARLLTGKRRSIPLGTTGNPIIQLRFVGYNDDACLLCAIGMYVAWSTR